MRLSNSHAVYFLSDSFVSSSSSQPVSLFSTSQGKSVTFFCTFQKKNVEKEAVTGDMRHNYAPTSLKIKTNYKPVLSAVTSSFPVKVNKIKWGWVTI